MSSRRWFWLWCSTIRPTHLEDSNAGIVELFKESLRHTEERGKAKERVELEVRNHHIKSLYKIDRYLFSTHSRPPNGQLMERIDKVLEMENVSRFLTIQI